MFAGMTSPATAPLLTDDDNTVPAQAPTGPAPQAPQAPAPATGRVEDHILPSGRIVRLRRVTTAEYLGAKERATLRVGKAPDPRGQRMTAALDRELLALMVQAYTAPEDVDWHALMQAQAAQQQAAWDARFGALPVEERPAFVYVPDRAGLIAQVPLTLFRPTTPQELLTVPGRTLDAVFTEVADWEVLTACAATMMLPTRDLSAIVGKARVVG